MVNRLKELFGEPEEGRPPASDYYVVEASYEDYYVTRETALRLLSKLDGPDPPRWMHFIDLWGTSISIRTDRFTGVRECTEAQRTSAREFYRARRREEKADRQWDIDD